MYRKSLIQGDCSRMSTGSGNRTSAPVQALDHKSNSLPLDHCAWPIAYKRSKILLLESELFPVKICLDYCDISLSVSLSGIWLGDDVMTLYVGLFGHGVYYTCFGWCIKSPGQTSWSRLLAEVWVRIPTEATCCKPLLGYYQLWTLHWIDIICALDWGLINYIRFPFFPFSIYMYFLHKLISL